MSGVLPIICSTLPWVESVMRNPKEVRTRLYAMAKQLPPRAPQDAARL
jgi:hypothetical protein